MFYYETIKINNIKELWGKLHSLATNVDSYIYRGVPNENYDLIPSIHRIDVKTLNPYINDYKSHFQYISDITYKDHCTYLYDLLKSFARHSNLNGLPILMDPLYKKMINTSENSLAGLVRQEFVYKKNNYQTFYPSEKYLDLMAVSQHYGLPTELIDFTFNPYTALYFSIRDVLYAYLKTGSISQLGEENIALWYVDNKYISENMKNDDFPLRTYISVYSNNPNLNSQKGIFLYWSHQIKSKMTVNRTSLTKLFGNSEYYKKGVFNKIIIPKHLIFRIYDTLKTFNHAADSLFPGYFGVEKRMKEDKIAAEMENHWESNIDFLYDLMRGK